MPAREPVGTGSVAFATARPPPSRATDTYWIVLTFAFVAVVAALGLRIHEVERSIATSEAPAPIEWPPAPIVVATASAAPPPPPVVASPSIAPSARPARGAHSAPARRHEAAEAKADRKKTLSRLRGEQLERPFF